MQVEQDKRTFDRFSARFPLKYKHSRNEFGTDVFLRDASAEGLKVATKERLFLHDSVSLEVKLPDSFNPMTLNGQVVWVKSKSPDLWEAGLRFHKINLMEMQRIFKLVAQD
ncbi:MAG: PilZ domain-containing protein [Candidatus Omnitrophota bacterium]|nr:PilZ domain-containing protein [Candidatus Omnitrophota bacterium]MDZ4243263.1 PilZ domain-containing protein [Candidatus Omnitrophota bacterium]